MAINKKRESYDVREAKSSHSNFMGGQSFDVSNPLVRLRMAAASCFFGEPQYYLDSEDTKKRKPATASRSASRLSAQDLKYLRSTLDARSPSDWHKLTPAQVIERCIDEALDVDPRATLLEAVRLRQEEHIRATPQVILVRASMHASVRGTGMIREHAPKILERADEPSTGLAYFLSTYGDKTPIPNALKKAWKAALERFREYDLAKYRMENRQVKTVDVVNLVHPKSDAVNKLVRGELRQSESTWEAIISKDGSNQASWEKALDVMGHMAMLRNIRNLLSKGVNPDQFLKKLVSGAANGKQLPFRYVSAYNAVRESGSVQAKDAIEECLMLSLGNLPKFSGRTMSLCDNSGSAQGTATSSMGTMKVSQIGNLTGILTGMRSDEGHLGVFGDNLETFGVRKRSSVFDQLDQAERLATGIGQGTENGIWLFWKQAIEKREHWDSVFVYSDMQAGHGGLYGNDPRAYSDYLWTDKRHIDVAKLIRTYRNKVNPNVNVFLVQVAGGVDTIIPEYYNRTYILGGWGDGLLRFAAEMSGMNAPTTQNTTLSQ